MIMLRCYFSLILLFHVFPLDNEVKAIFYMLNFKLEVLKNDLQVWEKLLCSLTNTPRPQALRCKRQDFDSVIFWIF